MFLVLVGKPKGVLHSTAGYMLYVATTFKYTFDHQAGGGRSSNAHHRFIHALVNADPLLFDILYLSTVQCGFGYRF
jgi:acyl-coenzyme A synthetase/AMP-(fatty) acid ligase